MTSSAVIASPSLYGAAAAAEMFSLVGQARVVVGGEERLQIGADNPEKLKLGFWARLFKYDPERVALARAANPDPLLLFGVHSVHGPAVELVVDGQALKAAVQGLTGEAIAAGAPGDLEIIVIAEEGALTLRCGDGSRRVEGV